MTGEVANLDNSSDNGEVWPVLPIGADTIVSRKSDLQKFMTECAGCKCKSLCSDGACGIIEKNLELDAATGKGQLDFSEMPLPQKEAQRVVREAQRNYHELKLRHRPPNKQEKEESILVNVLSGGFAIGSFGIVLGLGAFGVTEKVEIGMGAAGAFVLAGGIVGLKIGLDEYRNRKTVITGDNMAVGVCAGALRAACAKSNVAKIPARIAAAKAEEERLDANKQVVEEAKRLAQGIDALPNSDDLR